MSTAVKEWNFTRRIIDIRKIEDVCTNISRHNIVGRIPFLDDCQQPADAKLSCIAARGSPESYSEPIRVRREMEVNRSMIRAGAGLTAVAAAEGLVL